MINRKEEEKILVYIGYRLYRLSVYIGKYRFGHDLLRKNWKIDVRNKKKTKGKTGKRSQMIESIRMTPQSLYRVLCVTPPPPLNTQPLQISSYQSQLAPGSKE